MRFIEKGPEPSELTDWKGQGSDNWTPTYSGLDSPTKQAMRGALCGEQHGLCAYCQRRIEPTGPTAVEIAWTEAVRDGSAEEDPPPVTKIEHVEPQSKKPELALEWTNLVGVCLGLGPATEALCERARGNKPLNYWPNRDKNIDQMFEFKSMGSMVGVDGLAQSDVDTLRLDAPYYRTRRGDAIAGALRVAIDEEMTAAEVEILLEPAPGGLQEYVTAVVHVLRRELGPVAG